MNDTPLQPYAVRADRSQGRRHDDPWSARHDPFALDRQRVVHCAAFRRLQYKTQVFVIHEQDHFRTRLTHTLEVADIARRLAATLGANAPLAEVIALAHDLGHPPFGHAGEAVLAERMADHGGFEHNAQSLRTVEYLEHPYPPFRGLNLTLDVLDGLALHATTFDRPDVAAPGGSRASVEAQIASIADQIAYDCHDVEDAIGADLVDTAALADLSLWQDAFAAAVVADAERPLAAVRRPVLDALEAALLDDVVREAKSRLAADGIDSPDRVRANARDVVAFSASMAAHVAELEGFLREHLYRHHRLIRMDAKARRFLDQLFSAYVETPDLLPPRYARRIAKQGLHRVVCDYVAGMTDRYCLDEYKRLFLPSERA